MVVKVLQILPDRENQSGAAHAERIFATLFGLQKLPGFFGDVDAISFEIVATDGELKFFLRVPRGIEDFVKSQIYAQYPSAQIVEAGEFFEKNGAVYVTEVTVGDKFVPLTQYRDLRDDDAETKLVDPLSSVFSALLSVAGGGSLALQIRFVSVGDKFWKSAVRKSLDDTENPSPHDKALREKVQKHGFLVNLSFWAQGCESASVVGSTLQQIFPAGLKMKAKKFENCERARAKKFLPKRGVVLNTAELATLWHLPTQDVGVPNIVWVRTKEILPPSNLPREGSRMLGTVTFRGESREFGILPIDRRRHIYIVGKTGMGKSTLLENMIFADLAAGEGVAVIDPHGELADFALANIPKERTNDVILFDPADAEFPVAFNIFDESDPERFSIVSSGIIAVFKHLWGEYFGPRMEHIVRNCVLALLANEGTTMLGILKMLSDEDYRKRMARNVKDPMVKNFWNDEFPAMMRTRVGPEALIPIQNRLGQLFSSSILRNILGQPRGRVSIRQAMDEKKIVIANLSKGKIGEDVSAMLGQLLVTRFQLDAMSRADTAKEKRADFHLYVDEFQNFATNSFAVILSEARKYGLCLIVANQYIAQMSDEIRDAVFGNVGTVISFQLGYADADVLEKQFGEVVSASELAHLGIGDVFIRMLVDGQPTAAFAARTQPPREAHKHIETRMQKVRAASRNNFSGQRKSVEEKIEKFAFVKKRQFSPRGKDEKQSENKTGAKEILNRVQDDNVAQSLREKIRSAIFSNSDGS